MSSPVSPHTSRSTVLALAILNKIQTNANLLGINEVRYGRHVMVPKSPAVNVSCAPKRRTLRGVSAPGGRTMNRMVVYIDIMTQEVLNGEANARLMTDQLSEEIEDLLHEDTTMGGIIIHGFVEDWDPGDTMIRDSQFRTVRLTFVGQSETYLSA